MYRATPGGRITTELGTFRALADVIHRVVSCRSVKALKRNIDCVTVVKVLRGGGAIRHVPIQESEVIINTSRHCTMAMRMCDRASII